MHEATGSRTTGADDIAAEVCPLCQSRLERRHCKAVCPACGYVESCEDLFRALPPRGSRVQDSDSERISRTCGPE